MAQLKDLLVEGKSRFIDKIYASDQFISKVVQGTSPFLIDSSTLVSNLNADLVDGQHFSYTNTNNTPTYLWGTSSNGTSYLVSRTSMHSGIADKVMTVANTTDALHYLTFVDSNNTPNAAEETLYTSNKIVFNPGTGNVGIGTTSPSQKLHVTGTIYSSVAQGTAPLKVDSSSIVAKLNVDLLDGAHSSDIRAIHKAGTHLIYSTDPYLQDTSLTGVTTPTFYNGYIIDASTVNVPGAPTKKIVRYGDISTYSNKTFTSPRVQIQGGRMIRFDCWMMRESGGTGTNRTFTFKVNHYNAAGTATTITVNNRVTVPQGAWTKYTYCLRSPATACEVSASFEFSYNNTGIPMYFGGLHIYYDDIDSYYLISQDASGNNGGRYAGPIVYKHARAYANNVAGYKKFATWTTATLTSERACKLVILVSGGYSLNKAEGILTVNVRWAAGSTAESTPTTMTAVWTLIGSDGAATPNINPNNFILTWKINTSGEEGSEVYTATMNLYCYRPKNYTAYAFNKLEEQSGYGAPVNYWVFYDSNGSYNSVTAIPAAETQVTSVIGAIQNKTSTADVADTALALRIPNTMSVGDGNDIAGPYIYKHGRGYGGNVAGYKKIASWTTASLASKANSTLVLLVTGSNRYTNTYKSQGILTLNVNWAAGSTAASTPTIMDARWSLASTDVDPSLFILTWKINTSGEEGSEVYTATMTLYYHLSTKAYRSHSFQKLDEFGENGYPTNNWTLYDATGSTNNVTSIPAAETQVISVLGAIKNNAATATEATHAANASNADNADKLDNEHAREIRAVPHRMTTEVFSTDPIFNDASLTDSSLWQGTVTKNPSTAVASSTPYAPGPMVLKCGIRVTSPAIISEYVPVQPGRTIKVDTWLMRLSGASGTNRTWYVGVLQFDRNKNAIAANSGRLYLMSGITGPGKDSKWIKYSYNYTVPLTGTPYPTPDPEADPPVESVYKGDGVCYLRFFIMPNYNGTSPTVTYFGGLHAYYTDIYNTATSSDSATTATSADTVKTVTRSTNAAHYLSFVDSDNTNPTSENVYTSSKIVFNPSTGSLGLNVASPTHPLDTSGGVITVTANGNTLSIGSQNASWTHFSNSANRPFYFSHSASFNGSVLPYTDNSATLGDSSHRWSMIYGMQATLKVAQGTAPLLVDSSTLVSNLNADLLDGNHASAFLKPTNVTGTTSLTLSTSLQTYLTVSGTNYQIKLPDTIPWTVSTTDDKVSQSETTTANYRGIVLGYNSNAAANTGITTSVINKVYVTNNLTVQPSTGNIVTKGYVAVGTGGVNSYVASDAANNIYLHNSSGAVLVATGKVVRRSTSLEDVSLGEASYPWAGVYAKQFISKIAQGTAPILVDSSTLVSNLNADLLDGLHSTNLVKLFNYSLPVTKGVRITFTAYNSCIINCCRSNGGGQLVLIGTGYGAGGTVRNTFTELVSCNESWFTWSLPQSDSISCSVEIMHNASSGAGDATVYVHSSGNVTFTAINALTSEKTNRTLLHSSNYTNYTVTKTGGGASGTWDISITGSAGSIDWANITNKPATATSYGYIGTTAVQASSATQNLTGIGSVTASGDNIITKASTSDTYFRVVNNNGTISLLTSSNRGLYNSTGTAGWVIATNGTNSWLAIGNIGIGTTSPSQKLHVAGTIYSSVAQGTAPLKVDSSTQVTNLKSNFAQYADVLRDPVYYRYVSGNLTSGRRASGNVNWADGGLHYFLATSSMTTGKPAGDGHILHMSWDNGSYEGQFVLPTSTQRSLQWRSQNGGTWSDWITVLDSSNYTSYLSDTKVTQTVTASSNTSWRPLLLGYSYSDATTFAPTTVTNTTYATHLAKFKPSTGQLAIGGLYKMNTNGTQATGANDEVWNTNGTTVKISTLFTTEPEYLSMEVKNATSPSTPITEYVGVTITNKFTNEIIYEGVAYQNTHLVPGTTTYTTDPISIPPGIEYVISCSPVSGFKAPADGVFLSIPGYSRTVQLNYTPIRVDILSIDFSKGSAPSAFLTYTPASGTSVIQWIRNNSHRYAAYFAKLTNNVTDGDGKILSPRGAQMYICQLKDNDSTKFANNTSYSYPTDTSVENGDIYMRLPKFYYRISGDSSAWTVEFADSDPGQGFQMWDPNNLIGVYPVSIENNVPMNEHTSTTMDFYMSSPRYTSTSMSTNDICLNKSSCLLSAATVRNNISGYDVDRFFGGVDSNSIKELYPDVDVKFLRYKWVQMLRLLFLAYYNTTNCTSVCGTGTNTSYCAATKGLQGRGMTDTTSSTGNNNPTNFWGVEDLWGTGTGRIYTDLVWEYYNVSGNANNINKLGLLADMVQNPDLATSEVVYTFGSVPSGTDPYYGRTISKFIGTPSTSQQKLVYSPIAFSYRYKQYGNTVASSTTYWYSSVNGYYSFTTGDYKGIGYCGAGSIFQDGINSSASGFTRICYYGPVQEVYSPTVFYDSIKPKSAVYRRLRGSGAIPAG